MRRHAALAALALTLACEPEARRGAPLRETVPQVSVSCSGALLPLMLEAANQYMRGSAGALVVVSEDVSGEAIRGLEAGTVAVAGVDHPPEPGRGADLEGRPLATVPVAILARRGPYNEAVRSLTRDQLHDVVTGRIANWSALGGRDQRIVFLNRARDTGERLSLSRWLGTDSFVAGAEEEASDATVQAALLARPGAISYVALPYRHPDLSILALDGAAPPVPGQPAGDYPLWIRTYLYMRRDAAPTARAFAAFLATPSVEGSLMEPLGLVPIR